MVSHGIDFSNFDVDSFENRTILSNDLHNFWSGCNMDLMLSKICH